MPEAAYPYTTVPNRLREILAKIPKLGKPDTVSQAWLKELGYTSGNDMSALSAMRKAGVVAQGGAPTEFWDALRTSDGAKVADHVRSAYRELFGLYPNAEQQGDEALRNFFRSKTTAGDKVQVFMVRTFKVFCEYGDFSSASPAPTVTPPDADKKPRKDPPPKEPARAAGLTLNVNIQLQLPPSADGEVYEKLFGSMAKHLKGLASLE